MRKIFEEEADQSKVEEFNDLLYSYSHKKFYDYISIPEVSVLLKIIFTQQGIEGFIQRHSTLSVHFDSYVDHISKIIKNI